MTSVMIASAAAAAAAAAVMSLLLFCPRVAQGQAITDQVKKELLNRADEWLEFYRNRNFKGLCLELYAEDCVISLPNATIARGREGCARAWETLNEEDYQYAGFYVNPIIKEVIVTSSGYVIEHSTIEDNVHQYIKYMLVWKRIGGKLYICHTIDNVNTPYEAPTLLGKIAERRNELAYYFNNRDFESACKVSTPDCWAAPPGAPPVYGRDGCERMMVKTATSGVARVGQVTEECEVYNLGDEYILNHGAMILYDEEGGELDRIKDMKIWKRLEDGQYYIHFNMWNSDIHF